MKIYIKVDPSDYDYVYPWREYVEEQVKETVGILYDNNTGFPLLHPDQDPLFPSFVQEDIHSRFVIRNGERYFLRDSLYTILYIWEPADFEDEYNEDLYAEISASFGKTTEHQEPIPEGYAYIGTYCYYQTEPINFSTSLTFLQDL